MKSVEPGLDINDNYLISMDGRHLIVRDVFGFKLDPHNSRSDEICGISWFFQLSNVLVLPIMCKGVGWMIAASQDAEESPGSIGQGAR